MTYIEKLLEFNKTLKGENASEILQDIDTRLWNIKMIDRWTQEDKETFNMLCDLEKIYIEIEERENRENGKK